MLMTGLLTLAYVAVVMLSTQVLRFHSPVAVAAATLAAALLFNPLRRRLHRPDPMHAGAPSVSLEPYQWRHRHGRKHALFSDVADGTGEAR